MAEVVALNSYPIKGCAPVSYDEVEVTNRGLPHDREFMVVAANGLFLNQIKHSRLDLVKTSVDGELLAVEAPNMGELTIPLWPEYYEGQEEVPVEVYKKRGTGVEVNKHASDYFTEYLGLNKPARLLRVSQPRQIKPELRNNWIGSEMRFADGAPTHLASVPSLRQLNYYVIDKALGNAIDMSAIRANIMIDGPDLEPYDEDYWRLIKVGNWLSEVMRGKARCSVPNVANGVMPSPNERAFTLAINATRYATEPLNDKPAGYFGIDLSHAIYQTTTLHVGDEIQVLSRATERNIELAKPELSLSE